MAERFSFEEYERRMKQPQPQPDDEPYDYPAGRDPEPAKSPYAAPGIGEWMDAHSLGWTDTSVESGGFAGWLLRVGFALAFVVAPIVCIVAAILWAIVH